MTWAAAQQGSSEALQQRSSGMLQHSRQVAA
jgi:hypothetical protein